jgi:PAS domain S-box-containing protein
MVFDDFKRTLETVNAAIAIADAKGAIVFVNNAFAHLVQREKPALERSTFSSLFTADARKRVEQNVARVAEGKAGSAFVDAALEVPGFEGDRWVQIALQPALDPRDKAAGVIAVLQDIGAQRDSEQALNLTAVRLLALAEASATPLMIENHDGEVELANAAFCQALHLESAPQSLTGVPVKEAFARSKHEGEAAFLRNALFVDDVELGAVWQPRSHAAGAPAKAAAEIALIEKIGMELSVAMEGISAIAIRAQQIDVDPALVEHFKRIRESTETAMAAIGDLVDFSKVSGAVALHKVDFRLRESIADLVESVGPRAEEHGCKLRIKIEQDVADYLEGDIERLRLVTRNLLDSAFRLLPGAEVTLQITPEYVTESGIQLSFSIVTSGGDAVSRATADAGMSVAVAKFMVAAMGGKLAVATVSTADALYSFTLEFPVKPAPPAPPRATYVSLIGMSILIVSGDPEQRLALSNVLRGWRMVPLEADNAAMAMALLERLHSEAAPIPLVILSNKLPVQDGFLLAFRIKQHPKYRATLVMMLASEGKPGDAIACRENGISAYMRYPINDRQLNEAIVAVTGASVDAEETPTLVTRHSLREHRKGATILLVDPNRDSQILAAHILGRRDCSIVVAQNLEEAKAALDQDLYDIVLVDTSLPGLNGDDAARTLRSHITRDAERAQLVATSVEHSPAFRKAKTAIGFNSTVGKPFRKDDLLALLQSLGRVAVEA